MHPFAAASFSHLDTICAGNLSHSLIDTSPSSPLLHYTRVARRRIVKCFVSTTHRRRCVCCAFEWVSQVCRSSEFNFSFLFIGLHLVLPLLLNVNDLTINLKNVSYLVFDYSVYSTLCVREFWRYCYPRPERSKLTQEILFLQQEHSSARLTQHRIIFLCAKLFQSFTIDICFVWRKCNRQRIAPSSLICSLFFFFGRFSVQQLTGYAPQELIDKTLYKFVHASDAMHVRDSHMICK